jgi:adenylyltransferase/sulfurtransferase
MDRLEMRYLLNDACVKHGLPWFYGGVEGYPQFGCLCFLKALSALRFSRATGARSIPTCDMSGVLGSSVSVAAAMEVTQLLRFLSRVEYKMGTIVF